MLLGAMIFSLWLLVLNPLFFIASLLVSFIFTTWIIGDFYYYYTSEERYKPRVVVLTLLFVVGIIWLAMMDWLTFFEIWALWLVGVWGFLGCLFWSIEDDLNDYPYCMEANRNG